MIRTANEAQKIDRTPPKGNYQKTLGTKISIENCFILPIIYNAKVMIKHTTLLKSSLYAIVIHPKLIQTNPEPIY